MLILFKKLLVRRLLVIGAVLPVRTLPVQLEPVRLQLEPVLRRHLLLKSFDIGTFKLDDLGALVTDQMVMMLFLRDIVIDRFMIAEMALLRDTDLTQQVQCAVDGGQPDLRILPVYKLVQIFGRNVIRLKKGLEYHLPLLCELQLLFRKVILETFHLNIEVSV
jgi:hypothetical protein